MLARVMFSLREFVRGPSLKLLDSCCKEKLLAVAAHYEIKVSRQLLKEEVKDLVLDELGKKGAISLGPPTTAGDDSVTAPDTTLLRPGVLGTPAEGNPLSEAGSPDDRAARGEDWKEEQRFKTQLTLPRSKALSPAASAA